MPPRITQHITMTTKGKNVSKAGATKDVKKNIQKRGRTRRTREREKEEEDEEEEE